ncbi:hypothetical protein ACQ86N_05760 [Puia sp. P3]|uniref:hypothetical protein n=1 Tax=Puia sp. P3 TaxID=3423952 RepID=UPI003D67F0EB
MKHQLRRRLYIVVGLLIVLLKGFAQDGSSNIEFVENKGQVGQPGKIQGRDRRRRRVHWRTTAILPYCTMSRTSTG